MANKINKRWQFYSTICRDVRDKFIDFLKENGIYFERSGGIFGWNFEVKASDAQFVWIDAYFSSLPRRLNEIENIQFEVA